MTNSPVDDFLSEHSAAAGGPLNVQAAGTAPESQNKKRKVAQENETSKKPKVQENRAIYVTNLPLDATPDEVENTFKKYGIIDRGADGQKRIKMYTDDNGNFTGEALIVYFKRDSIDLAIRMMDDYFFRLEDQSGGTIRVKEADFSYKREKDGSSIAAKLTRKDRKASERNRADLHRKLAEWSDNEEEVAEAFAPKKNKWAKVVIVKYAFTIEAIEENPAEMLEVKEDMHEEASKFGHVTNVILFDKEKDGIVTIRFREFEDAEKFREAVHGRNFDKRKLEATLAEDKPKFKKSPREQESDSEDD